MLEKSGREARAMNRMRMILAAGAAAMLTVGVAWAQFPFPGYFGDRLMDTSAAIPPAPQPGSPLAEADRAVFLSTRALEGTPRWDMAIEDLDERRAVYAMRCAIGVEIKDLGDAPKLSRVLLRVAPDITRAIDAPKAFYNRKRPYLEQEGEICTARSEDLAKSPDYPSGHSSWGWAVGLILAELAPDRAVPILQRARAYGESRVVCGVHTASAVAAGRDNGAAVVAAMHGVPDFRTDMEAARAELAGLRAKAAPLEGCEAEAAVLAKPAW
ncbi:MAG: phosphatase PAP2 family protein [Caulobacter sp.]|nr:phosphatase PAP2 family protein [Caulobacter sp.]